jgi:hypothetical protein
VGNTEENEEAAMLEENEGATILRTNEGASHWERDAPATFQTRSGHNVKVSAKVLDSSEKWDPSSPNTALR